MKISYNWLRKFINLKLSPEETAEKLTLIGLEVETIETFGSLLKGVIVGEVTKVTKHPNADRLQLCQVNIGEDTVQIVCGAKNVAIDQKVAVATLGSTLPPSNKDSDPFTIRKAKLRGELSEGMICAEDELGLGADHSGIMVLNDDLTPGIPIHKALHLYQDTIIDVAVTPNRPDVTCHLGVARDLAAACDLELTSPFETDFEKAGPLNDFDISIKNSDKCHRYAGKIIKNVTIAESPDWLQNQLQAVGVRPVNNVVDVTNYVMFELGQPLHAFDKEQLQGNEIIVRDFNDERQFETLDHIKRTCPAGTLFICDGESPVAIAGIMGGVDSEVSETTTDILVESAYFNPGTIRKTAKQQTLQTESSYRFERGIDPQIQRIAAERAAQLIAEVANGTIRDECSDVHPVTHQTKKITLRASYTNRLLGTEFSIDKIKALLNGLGLVITEENEEQINCEIPSFRPDLQREVDLVEEVGRLFDYNNIPKPDQGTFSSPEPITAWEKLNNKIKHLAKELRFREIYSNSLISEADAIRVGQTKELLHTLNPISADMTTLRPTLLHGFLQSAAYNFNRDASSVRFFETGHVFTKSTNGTYYKDIHEESKILFGLAGLKTIEHWNSEAENYSAFDLKAVINSFLTSLDINRLCETKVNNNDHLDYYIENTKIGELLIIDGSLRQAFELDVPAFIAELSISKIFDIKKNFKNSSYQPVSKFPAFEFDFGVIVDAQLRAKSLLKVINTTAKDLLDDIQVFDVFEHESLGENKKSIAFRLSFIDKNKTLTIKDVEPIIDNILDVLDNKFSAKLRS